MPEEINRIVTDVLSDLHFVTSPEGVDQLAAEGIKGDDVHLVGNPMIDTLERFRDNLDLETARSAHRLPERYAIATVHRPANVDDPIVAKELVIGLTHVASRLLVLHGAENFDLDHINTLTSQLPYPTHTIPCPTKWTLGDCLNTGLDHATGTYITKMDGDDHYGPHHLTDVHTAHITGKWGNIVYLAAHDLTLDWRVEREESFGTHIPGATMLVDRSVLAGTGSTV